MTNVLFIIYAIICLVHASAEDKEKLSLADWIVVIRGQKSKYLWVLTPVGCIRSKTCPTKGKIHVVTDDTAYGIMEDLHSTSYVQYLFVVFLGWLLVGAMCLMTNTLAAVAAIGVAAIHNMMHTKYYEHMSNNAVIKFTSDDCMLQEVIDAVTVEEDTSDEHTTA